MGISFSYMFYLAHFWQHYPALFMGLSLLIGFQAFLYATWLCLIPLSLCWIPFLYHYYKAHALASLHWFLLSFFLFLSAVVYMQVHYRFPAISSEGIHGTAIINIRSIQMKKTPFSHQWLYHCEIESFQAGETAEVIAKNIPCTIKLPLKKRVHRPPANQKYQVSGTLKVNNQGNYQFSVTTKKTWGIIPTTWSLAETRYQAKQWVKKWIEKRISDRQSAQFLSGLATGEFEDRQMSQEFGRFGLQHVMAISGFHFAIIASIIGFFLRIIIPFRFSALFVMILLSVYFIFLGLSASIVRSWTMISIAMVGIFMEKTPNSLNSLGIALITTLLIDPLLAQSLGFQLSFLTTAAILIFYPVIDAFLETVLIKRPLSELIIMNKWNQHAYIILAIFRQGLSLTLAVNIVALPTLMYLYHTFPVLSLVYNFFFPFLVSISMFCLIIGVFVPGINYFNDWFTQWVLQTTHQMPKSLDVYISGDFPTLWFLVIYLTIVFGFAISKNEHKKMVDRFTFL